MVTITTPRAACDVFAIKLSVEFRSPPFAKIKAKRQDLSMPIKGTVLPFWNTVACPINSSYSYRLFSIFTVICQISARVCARIRVVALFF